MLRTATVLVLACLAVAGCGSSKRATPPSPGEKLFVAYGCGACHVYRGTGVQSLKAPDLSHEGSLRSPAEIKNWILCATCIKRAALMPAFARLPAKDIDTIAAFLAASK